MDRIYTLLRKLGINSTYVGFYHLAYAIHLTLENEMRLLHITKEIYPQIAAYYKTAPCNVEHNIRTVVNICWNKNKDYLQLIAGCPLDSRPSNSEFIDILVCYLKDNQSVPLSGSRT